MARAASEHNAPLGERTEELFRLALRGWRHRPQPMERIKPPRRPHPEDLDVTAVSGADVRRLFDACETWTELLCLSTLAYLGPRRRAASNLRRRDVDIERGTMR